MSSGDQASNKNWELSLYELNRTPHEIVTDNTEIAVSPWSLQSELMCPICLDMLKKTHTTKECLHRFCCDCIVTALRSGNKECPTCRKKLVSKRSLRPDPNFDLLISKIYPSRDEYEAHQEKIMAKLNQAQSQAALVTSITEGMKIQSQNRSQKRKNIEDTQDNAFDENSMGSFVSSIRENHCSNSTSVRSTPSPIPSTVSSVSTKVTSTTKRTKSIVTSERSEGSVTSESRSEGENSQDSDSDDFGQNGEIELVFKPHPTEMPEENQALINALRENAVRYIKTCMIATVDHLCKYLAMRMTLDLDPELPYPLNFCIYISPQPGQFIMLGGNQTLKQINEKYWKFDQPLELYYSWKKT